MKSYFKFDDVVVYDQINAIFTDFIKTLSNKRINYSELKNGLIPSHRKEIALFFDIAKIKSDWYGYEVFSKLIPLFEKGSCHSVLVGDYIGSNKFSSFFKSEFFEHIKPVQEIEYKSHDQFYIVYLNNQSDAFVKTVNNKLKQFNSYVGYCDLTYSSPLKSYLSTILIRLFLKYKSYIIGPFENSDEDVNMTTYPFEENGYTCKSIETIQYGLFLSYKIEREVFKGFEADTLFSINAVSKNVFNISDFKLIIEEKKFKYLLDAKKGNLERAGMTALTLKELELLIKNKIDKNYIYNLSYRSDTNTIKFNILIETKRVDTNLPMKLMVALEYKPVEKILRLITMF